jgi:hypothetical protein
MTHSVSPEGFRASLDVIETAGRAADRDMTRFGNIVTAVVNVQADRDTAVSDAKRYLELYHGANYTPACLGPDRHPGRVRRLDQPLPVLRLSGLHLPPRHHGRRDGATAASDRRGLAPRRLIARHLDRRYKHSRRCHDPHAMAKLLTVQ